MLLPRAKRGCDLSARKLTCSPDGAEKWLAPAELQPGGVWGPL